MHPLQGARRAAAQRRPLSASFARAWLPGAGASFGLSLIAGWVVRASLPPDTERVLVPHVLSLHVLHNTGVAFGLLAGLPPIAVVILALTLLGVVFYNKSARPATAAGHWGLGLMIGGALANVVERVYFGYVLDYVDLRVWPVFNLADTAIVVGAGLLVFGLSSSRPSRMPLGDRSGRTDAANPGGER